MGERLNKKQLFDLVISASAGDREAYKQLLEMGMFPQARRMAIVGLKNRYKWKWGEELDEDSIESMLHFPDEGNNAT